MTTMTAAPPYVVRPLTDNQQERLEEIADDTPEAKVVGWHVSVQNMGPIVRWPWDPDGVLRQYVTPKGYLRRV